MTHPSIEGADVVGGGDVNFTLIDDGQKIYCRISREALEDHFGANGDDQLRAFNANHEAIAEKAAEIWKMADRQGAKYTSQDRLIIKSAYF